MNLEFPKISFPFFSQSSSSSMMFGVDAKTAAAKKNVEEAIKDIDGPVSYDEIAALLKKFKSNPRPLAVAPVQQTASEPTKSLEEKIQELDALKEKYLPMIRTNYRIVIREACMETITGHNLSDQDISAIFSLIYDEFEKKMELSKQWEVFTNQIKNTLSPDLWEEAVKHQVFSNMAKVQEYKPQMLQMLNEVYSAFKEAEKTSAETSVGEKLQNQARGKNKQ